MTGPVRRALAVGQIGGAALLVIAAGLLVRSLWTLSHVDPGFRSRGVVTARLTPDVARCGEPRAAWPSTARSRIVCGRSPACAAPRSSMRCRSRAVSPSVRSSSRAMSCRPGNRAAVPPDHRDPGLRPCRRPAARRRPRVGRSRSRRRVGGAGVGDDRPPLLARPAGRRAARPLRRRVALAHRRRRGRRRARPLRSTPDEPDWIDGTLYVPHAADVTLEDGRPPAEMMTSSTPRWRPTASPISCSAWRSRSAA